MKSQNIDITDFEDNLEIFKSTFGKNYNLASRRFETAIQEIDNVDKWNEFIDSANEAAEAEDQKKNFRSTNYFTKVSNKQLLKETKEAPEDETTTQK